MLGVHCGLFSFLAGATTIYFRHLKFKAMWFHLGVQNLVAKKNHNGECCEIFVSDFMRIWHKSLSNNEILSISQDLNPRLEASVQKLKEITLNLLEDTKAAKEVKEENTEISLKLQSQVWGVKFQFQVLLKRGDEEMLYKELTSPLLRMLFNLNAREKKLIKIIKDKDEEISAYKKEFGPRLEYMASKTFNLNEFNRQESGTCNSLDPAPIIECIGCKLQTTEGIPLSLEDEPKKQNSSNTPKAKTSVFKDKTSNMSSGFRPCIFLENQTIKKIKTHNERFKIKL